MDLILLSLLGLAVVLGTPVLAIGAFARGKRQERVLRDLTLRVQGLERALARLPETTPDTASEPARHATPTPLPSEIASPPKVETTDANVAPDGTVPDDPPTPNAPSPPPIAPPGAGSDDPPENGLADRWLIWVGGIALALGGAFLVRHSIDQGWLVPWLRCLMGGLLGAGLVILGYRNHGRAAPGAPGRPGRRAAAALVAAGLSSMDASLFAAHALYGLIGPLAAVLAMAGVSAAGVLLSLRHGPFVAALAVLGGYAVPGVVQVDDPSPTTLFGYLLALTLAAAVLPRWRPWPWLGWLSLAGNGLFAGMTLALTTLAPGEDATFALFLLAMAGIVAAARIGVPQPLVPALADARHDTTTRWLTEATVALAAVFLVLLALVTDQGAASLAGLLALTLGGLALARRDETLWLPALAPVLAGLLTLAGWDLRGAVGSGPDALLNPPLPESVAVLLTLAILQAGVVALGGHGLAGRPGPRPMTWAGLATATPLVILCVIYWRLHTLGVDLAWAAMALGLGGLALLGAWRLVQGPAGALGAHAVGVLAAVALAAAFALEQAWLTVALAATLPAVAWVEGRLGALPVPGLRGAALAMAGVVLVRLLLNPYVLDYPLGASSVIPWLLYGYGLPSLAFALAARWFLRRRDDRLVDILEGGAIVLGLLMAMLEVRHLMAGPTLTSPDVTLAEWAAQSVVCLAAVVFLQAWRQYRPGGDRAVVVWAEHGLAAMTGLALLAGPVTVLNPVLTGDPVGSTPVLNTLLGLYAIPAALLGWWAWRASADSWPRRLGSPVAAVLAWMWLTLELRRTFAGPTLDQPAPVEAELYAYSVLWLAFGVAVLAVGTRLRVRAARRAGLGVVLAVTLKVFLVDMAGLTGLWRALSFLGLGAALVGLGAVTRALERPTGKPPLPRPEHDHTPSDPPDPIAPSDP